MFWMENYGTEPNVFKVNIKEPYFSLGAKGEKLEEFLAENPLNIDDLKYPPKELIKELLTNRLDHPD